MFESYHPTVNFIYFIVTLLIIIFTENIVILFLFMLGYLLFLFKYKKSKQMLKEMLYLILLIVLMMIINPLVSHNGMTIMFFLNGKPITFESMVNGFFIGLLLATMLLWGRCYNEVMTSDKFIYVFGRITPHFALVISMTMRLIPLFKRKAVEVYSYQKVNIGKSTFSYVDKLMLVMKTFSIIITWSFENALNTADSMKARGYGIRKRTSYSLYRFTFRDFFFLVILFFFFGVIVYISINEKINYVFYPLLIYPKMNRINILLYCLSGGIAFIPWIFEIKEKIVWKYYRLKI